MNVFVTGALADLHKELKPHYSAIGRPSIDPELMIRMLIVGYCYRVVADSAVGFEGSQVVGDLLNVR